VNKISRINIEESKPIEKFIQKNKWMTKNTLTQTCLNYFQADGGLEGLSVNEVREQYNNLIKCIKEHNELYYTQLEPVISDYEYDQLFAYLQKIESRHPSLIVFDSPTQNLQDQLSVSE
jgi:hypothetical protein